MTVSSSPVLTFPELRDKAITLLATREYSAQELRRKFSAKSTDAILDELLEWLQSNNYQSDSRYALVYIRSKANAGYGPLRIRQGLKQKGVTASIIVDAFDEFAGDWFVRAEQVYQKKYRSPITASDRKERAKRQRFMSYRGFSMDHISYALEQCHDE